MRGGGHNVAGRAVTNGGVMIDLAEMKGIDVDPERADRPRRGRRPLERAQRRRRRARSRRHRRRDLDDGDRRLHARRRAGLADGEARPRGRQPARRRARHGRRRGARRRAPSRTPTCSGRCAAAAATSASPTSFTYRVHPLQMVVGGLIAHPIDAGPEMLRFYRDAVARLLGRLHRLRGARARTGRLRAQDRRR